MYPGDISNINEDWVTWVLEKMSEHAAEHGLKFGASVIMIDTPGMSQPKKLHFMYTGAYFMEPGTNHLGLALAKIARMARTMFSTQEEGGLGVAQGESNERGGITLHFVTGEIFIAYSGGTSEQNNEIVRYGVAISEFCDLE